MKKFFLICLIFAFIRCTEKCKYFVNPEGYSSCQDLSTDDTDYPNCCYEESADDGAYCDSYSDAEKNDLTSYAKQYNKQHDDNKITYINCGGTYTYGTQQTNKCELKKYVTDAAICNSSLTNDANEINCCYVESPNDDGAYCDSFTDSEKNNLTKYVTEHNADEDADDKITYVNCGSDKTYGTPSTNKCKLNSKAAGYESCSSLATNDNTEKTCCYEESGDGEQYCDSYSDGEISDLETYVNNYNKGKDDDDDKITYVNCGEGKEYTYKKASNGRYINAKAYIFMMIFLALF